MSEAENDGRWPDGTPCRTPYPTREMTAEVPRERWPWMDAEIEEQCPPSHTAADWMDAGFDRDSYGEWLLTITDQRVAVLEDGRPAADDADPGDVWHPQAFRDLSEIRAREEAEAEI